MNLLKLNDTTKVIPIFMADATTKVGKPGLTLTVTRSKNGAAFAAVSGASIVDLGNGHYTYAPAAGDVDTLGPLVWRATGAGADDFAARYSVVAYDPFDAVHLGLSAVPNAGAGAANGLPVLDGSGHNLVYSVAQGVNATQWNGSAVGGMPNSGAVTLAASQNFNNTGQTTKAPATLATADVTGNLPGDIKAVNGNANVPAKMALVYDSAFLGTVSSDATPTATSFTANATGSPGLSAADGFYSTPVGLLVMTSGAQKGKTARVTGYAAAGGVGTFTVEAFPGAPAAGDTFLVLSRG